MKARFANERVARVLAGLPEHKLLGLANRNFEPALDELLSRSERANPELFGQCVREVIAEYTDNERTN